MKYFLLTVSSLIVISIFSGCASRNSSLPFSTYSASECYQRNGYPEFLADGSIFCTGSPSQQLSNTQRHQIEQQKIQYQEQQRQAEAAESAANSAAWNSFNQSMQNLTNQMNQNTYNTQQSGYELQQMIDRENQRKQDKKTNYQLQQINNNLNNIRYGY
jgi:uncharacterized Zn finger protein (UPF0148 family)